MCKSYKKTRTSNLVDIWCLLSYVVHNLLDERLNCKIDWGKLKQRGVDCGLSRPGYENCLIGLCCHGKNIIRLIPIYAIRFWYNYMVPDKVSASSINLLYSPSWQKNHGKIKHAWRWRLRWRGEISAVKKKLHWFNGLEEA